MKVTVLPVSVLNPDPENIREDALEDISALAADIKDRGLQYPLRVYPAGTDRYTIWAGHRRWAALCMVGMTEADCVVVTPPTSTLDKLDGFVSDNELRRDLNPIERAKLYQRYITEGCDQADTARRCGTSQAAVSMHLRLLELPAETQVKVADGSMSYTGALKIDKVARKRAGLARNDTGEKHVVGAADSHFNRMHPLGQVVASRCNTAGHHGRVGPGCCACWEWAIRRDERAKAPAAKNGTVGSPDDTLSRMRCSRCSADGRARGTRCHDAVSNHTYADHDFELQPRQRVAQEA